MNLTQITSADLKKIAKLLEKRETLQARVARIDAALAKFESGEPGAPAKGKPGRKPGRPAKAKRAPRGAVKAAIIELVKGAGKTGITVMELAAKLGINYHRAFTWFYNTGKSVKEIKKVGPGKYGWAAASTPVARPVAAAKPQKPKAKKPGVAKETVIELVEGAGKAGITAKEIAGKLGVEAQRVYKWFNATGKKVKEIKKVGPATYRWVG